MPNSHASEGNDQVVRESAQRVAEPPANESSGERINQPRSTDVERTMLGWQSQIGLADGLDPSQHYDRLGCEILLGTLDGDFSLPALPDELRQGVAYSPAVCPDPCQTEFHDLFPPSITP